MNVRTKPPRAYRSSLRDAQSQQTRERILGAAKEFLETRDLADLTLRRLAELAEVSAPTVSAHFPTLDDLYRAFFVWLKPHIGTDLALPALSDFASMPAQLFPRFARQGRLLRNLMNTPAWDHLRAADWKAKQENWAGPIRSALPDLTTIEADRAAIALAAFSTPNLWRWLVDITGCSDAEAEQIAAWATGALAASLQRDASGLGDRPPSTASKPTTRKKGTPS